MRQHRHPIGSPFNHLTADEVAHWTEDAACRDVDPELFFPTNMGTPGRAPGDESPEVVAAKAVCARCPVRDECLSFAFVLEADGGNRYGVWGGTTPRERRRMTRGGAA